MPSFLLLLGLPKVAVQVLEQGGDGIQLSAVRGRDLLEAAAELVSKLLAFRLRHL